ncbi:MAG: hypothetical protein RIT81_32110 [Deltaproteobacteria bacterium]
MTLQLKNPVQRVLDKALEGPTEVISVNEEQKLRQAALDFLREAPDPIVAHSMNQATLGYAAQQLGRAQNAGAVLGRYEADADRLMAALAAQRNGQKRVDTNVQIRPVANEAHAVNALREVRAITSDDRPVPSTMHVPDLPGGLVARAELSSHEAGNIKARLAIEINSTEYNASKKADHAAYPSEAANAQINALVTEKLLETMGAKLDARDLLTDELAVSVAIPGASDVQRALTPSKDERSAVLRAADALERSWANEAPRMSSSNPQAGAEVTYAPSLPYEPGEDGKLHVEVAWLVEGSQVATRSLEGLRNNMSAHMQQEITKQLASLGLPREPLDVVFHWQM